MNPDNDHNPSVTIEWRLKDSNELTACCVDLINPLTLGVPTIAPGTCGWSNQGLHAQGQIGGVNWLKAITSSILPIGKSIDDYEVKTDKKGNTVGKDKFKRVFKSYDLVKMKADITTRFAELKKEGGAVAAVIATIANGIVNAAAAALAQAKFTSTLELRAAMFTAGFSGSFQIADVIKKLTAALPKKK